MTKNMTMTKYQSRRALLRNLGISAAALPFVGSLGSLARAQTPAKKRLIAIYTPNGFVYQHWRPTGGETNFVLSPVLAPLERHRDKINILDRVSAVASLQGGVGHQRGMGAVLTGQSLAGGNGTAVDAGLANGISVDQELANKFGALTRFKSLQIGVQVDGNLANRYVNKRLSYRGPRDPLPPEGNPYVLFDTVFGSVDKPAPGGVPTVDLAGEKRRALRQSVLDSVLGDFQRLQPKMSSEDRLLLQNHTDSIRAVEKRLTTPDTSSVICKPTPYGDRIDVANKANHDKVGRLLMDVMVQAFACDLTRIATFMWSYSEAGVIYSWLGIKENDHAMQHAKAPQLAKVGAWYSEQFGYLIDSLLKIPDEGKTVFDNSVVLWGTCLADSAAHTRVSVPWVMAGSQGGYFKTGKYLKYNTRNDQTTHQAGDKSNNDLLVSVLNSFGVETTTFGMPSACNGPLPGLT